jgi:ABC-type Fe3+ transport system permease subunit
VDPIDREFVCPHCGAHMLAPEGEPDETLTITCPACSQLLTIEPLAAAVIEPFGERDDELDSARIDRHARMWRSLYRSRSHAVIATVVCAVAAAQLIVAATRRLLAGSGTRWGFFYLLVAIGLLVVAVLFCRRAIEINREARQMHDDARAKNS